MFQQQPNNSLEFSISIVNIEVERVVYLQMKDSNLYYNQPHLTSPWKGEEPEFPLLSKEGPGVVADQIVFSSK
jgi:hypothetical protein